MKIRPLRETDIDSLRAIHAKHYSSEFPFPNFLHHFLMTLAVTDDSGGIITAGGVKVIAESILITDKDRSPSERMRALFSALSTSSHYASANSYEHLHAFVSDEIWKEHLGKYGFAPSRSDVLVLPI